MADELGKIEAELQKTFGEKDDPNTKKPEPQPDAEEDN